MNTTVLRAGTPDVIALAFYQLGFRPRESLIMVGLHGPRQRVGVVVRVDLPAASQLRGVLRHELATLRRFGEEAVVLLVVSDTPADPRGRLQLPHEALVRSLLRQVRRSGWRVHDAIAVGELTWRSYLCRDPGCCPPQGRSLDLVMNSAAAVTMVAAGRVMAAGERALIADVDGPADLLPDAAAPTLGSAPAGAGHGSPVRLRAGTPAGTGATGRAGTGDRAGTKDRAGTSDGAAVPPDAGTALARWRGLLETARSPDTLPDVAWLAQALQDRWLRDAVLMTMVPESGTAPEELLAGADEEVLNGVFDRRPDDSLLERGRVVLAAAVRAAPPGERADALAVMAWMSWWSGEGTRGRMLTERALRDVPGHRLAQLVDCLLQLAIAPTWVRRGDPGRPGDWSDQVEVPPPAYPDRETGCS